MQRRKLRTGAESSTGQTSNEGAPKCQASTVDINDADKEGKEGQVSATLEARKVTFVVSVENAVPNQPAVDLTYGELSWFVHLIYAFEMKFIEHFVDEIEVNFITNINSERAFSKRFLGNNFLS